MRLEPDDDQVLHAELRRLRARAQPVDAARAADMIDEPQALALDRFEMRAARDQHDLVPAGGQRGSDDRADRSGADDGDAHSSPV